MSDKMNKISLDRMNLSPSDLSEEEIDMIYKLNISFNPGTKRWDGSSIPKMYLSYFINDEGILTLPLGKIHNVDMKNLNINSTYNFPTDIRHTIDISNNNLTSLEGMPSYIGSTLKCNNNKIESLEGLSSTLILDYFECSNNKIINLKGCPGIKYEIDCSNNPLESLKGMPMLISDREFIFKAYNNKLKNLAYSTTTALNIYSLYKIDELEYRFIRLDDITNITTNNLNSSDYKSTYNENEYHMALATYISKAGKESEANNIWWSPGVLPNIKNMFTSIKTINKFNL